MKRHQLTRLPPYLILHTKRFTKNNFVEEKNPTIVNFPLRGVDMKDCAFSFFSPFPFSFLFAFAFAFAFTFSSLFLLILHTSI
jgi:hypothetical protein